MDRRFKLKIAAAAAAAVGVAGGGAALASSQLGSPKAENDAIVSDAAKQLGVEPSKLSSALKKALEDRVDAAVAAGRLTKAQGDTLKERIESGDVPLFGGLHAGFHFGHFGHFGDLDAAASYLGLTSAQLESQLRDGKTLAQIARARDKSVDGLIDALVAAKRKRLGEAVADGRLTKAQETAILSDVRERVTDFVNGTAPRGFRFGSGPPSFVAPPL